MSSHHHVDACSHRPDAADSGRFVDDVDPSTGQTHQIAAGKPGPTGSDVARRLIRDPAMDCALEVGVEYVVAAPMQPHQVRRRRRRSVRCHQLGVGVGPVVRDVPDRIDRQDVSARRLRAPRCRFPPRISAASATCSSRRRRRTPRCHRSATVARRSIARGDAALDAVPFVDLDEVLADRRRLVLDDARREDV